MRKHLETFIKQECANWVTDHKERYYCLGCMPNTPRPFNDSGKCWVMHGDYCRYFEVCVLPSPDYPYRLAGYDYDKKKNRFRHKYNYDKIKEQYLPMAAKRKYFDSVAEYEKWHAKGWGALLDFSKAKMKAKTVGHNQCNECGAGIPPKKRYCEKCREKRNRVNKRNWKRKGRG